jgi:hypothetical protein
MSIINDLAHGKNLPAKIKVSLQEYFSELANRYTELAKGTPEQSARGNAGIPEQVQNAPQPPETSQSGITTLPEAQAQVPNAGQEVQSSQNTTIQQPQTEFGNEQIPEFKNTNEAIAFGKTATPEQIEQLKAKRDEAYAKSKDFQSQKNFDEAFKAGTLGQFYNEAIQANEGNPNSAISSFEKSSVMPKQSSGEQPKTTEQPVQPTGTSEQGAGEKNQVSPKSETPEAKTLRPALRKKRQ